MTEEGLRALAAFLPIFGARDFVAGEEAGGQETAPGVFHVQYISYTDQVLEFIEAAYEKGMILPELDWPGWAQTEEAARLRDDPAVLAKASSAQLSKLLTVVLRQDRFVDGALFDAFKSGLMLKIAERSAALVRESKS